MARFSSTPPRLHTNQWMNPVWYSMVVGSRNPTRLAPMSLCRFSRLIWIAKPAVISNFSFQAALKFRVKPETCGPELTSNHW